MHRAAGGPEIGRLAGIAFVALFLLTLQPASPAAATRATRATRAPGPEVTFTKDVAPILHARCATCHRPGEVAPMSLLTYEDARPWARAIRDRVVSRQMPPWPADRTVGHFTNDPSLDAGEIATISQWVDAGSPQGNRADMPALPKFPEGWQLGEPDLIVDLPEIEVPATGRDIFPTPVVKLDLKEDHWIRAVEIRPSNRQVAHHTVLFAGGSGLLAVADAADVLAVWAVGTPPTAYPQGMGRWLRKGQVISTNLHYHPNGTAAVDRTRVGLYFGKGELKKEVATGVAGNVTFKIPPRAAGFEMRAVYVADQDINIVSFFPHMHLRGRDMTMTATYPDGRQETLLRVPSWDFNWQLFYYPASPITLPRGTRVDVVAHYDNSAANRVNPDPEHAVTYGETTADEMMFGTFEYTAAEGVSPKPADDVMRMNLLLSAMPADSAFVLSSPFLMGRMSSGLYLPRSGDGTWYLAVRPSTVIAVPVTDIAWSGNAFQFSSELAAGGLGAKLAVTGEVAADGSVHGDVRPVGTGFIPFRTFTGARRR
jgi:hypothetical protein